jgi:REP element-mobilizing transposase RayT
MEYRRAKTPAGTFFFTVVTYNRHRFLSIPENIASCVRRFAMS